MTSTLTAFPSRTAVGALLAIATLFGGVAFARCRARVPVRDGGMPGDARSDPGAEDGALRAADRAREPETAERAHDHPFGRDHPGRVTEPEARSDRLARRRSRRRRDYRDSDGARRRPQPRSRRDLHVAARDLLGAAEPDVSMRSTASRRRRSTNRSTHRRPAGRTREATGGVPASAGGTRRRPQRLQHDREFRRSRGPEARARHRAVERLRDLLRDRPCPHLHAVPSEGHPLGRHRRHLSAAAGRRRVGMDKRRRGDQRGVPRLQRATRAAASATATSARRSGGSCRSTRRTRRP